MSQRSPLIGGDLGLTDLPSDRKGVFGNYPAYTPKYSQRSHNAGSAEDQARLYINIPDNQQDAFIEKALLYDTTGSLKDLITVLVNTAESGYGYVDFFLESLTMPFQEKMQVVEVLSDSYVSYFFGQKPPMFQLSGTFLNTRQDDQSIAFDILYQTVLRGTRMADLEQIVTLRCDNRIITGVLTNIQQQLTADMQMITRFGMSMLVKTYQVIHEPNRKATRLTPPRDIEPLEIETESAAIVSVPSLGNRTITNIKSVPLDLIPR